MRVVILIWAAWILFASMAGIWTFLEAVGVRGSPKITGLILLLSAAITIAWLGLSPERRKLIIRLLQGRVSSADLNVAKRRDFYPEILTAIKTAELEIVFFDGISSSLLNADFYCLLAERLEAAERLTIRFVMLSDQQLFLRIQHLRESRTRDDRRSFGEVIERKAQIAQLYAAVLDRIRPEFRSKAVARLSIQEWHLPASMVLVKIDDVVFLSVPSHRRHSNTVTIKLSDPKNPLYTQSRDYIDFIFTEGAYFLTPPTPELVPLLDEAGTVRLALPRNAVQSLGYRTKTIFGFVVDGTGRVLLRRRGEGAHDNRGLWDKSFGGHEDWGADDTKDHIATRELKEELLSDPVPEIFFAGDWEGLRKLDEGNRHSWIMVRLGRLERFTSQRRVGQKEVSKPMDVTLFACYCPEPHRIVPANPETAELQWIDLNTYELFVDKDDTVTDLKRLCGTPEFASLVQFANMMATRSLSDAKGT